MTSVITFPHIPDDIQWLKLSEFQKLVPSISPRTLRRWCEDGDIPASRRGSGRWWVDIGALRGAVVDQRRHAQRQEALDHGVHMFGDSTVSETAQYAIEEFEEPDDLEFDDP